MSGSGENPLVSILIPVRNRARLLAYCVNSALSQSLADLEVVIADNASDDGTWEVCEDLARRDGRVRIFRQATNCGPVLNWKFCINQARGAFGRLLFSDDLLKPCPLVVFRSHSGAFTRRMSREHYNDARYQAKVWFASRHEATDVLRDVLCSAWITRLMACRRPEWPSATARRYLDRPVGSASVLRCLRLIWHWIRMRRVSWWKAV